MSGVRRIATAAVLLGSTARPLDRSPVTTTAVEAPSAKSEEMYRQAYLEGFAAGEEDGRKEAQRQASASLQQLADALAEAEVEKQRWRESLREAIEQFAQATAQQHDAVELLAADVAEIAVRQIVGHLHAERRAVEAACRETLRALHVPSAQVRVSASDREAFGELPPGIELVADASLAPGACLLHSPLGDIDAGLATQLARLRETLAAALTSERA
ncbi:FliH/SctL family protein [Rhodanobacter sp. KK11]|uniref:FliH/SctL family protein n=1 Tax=Rhodanobacter sp. KK11 TaxID=3083255 RepID=UPI002966B81A|nr:FliH/SctL family protein [Rhodanobacter sp. KK11]MDW2981770.1 FliH/SctL family protein [Rhodanobacter sp. KK11]